MVVSERYPDLKANQGFRDLRVQLEGTENRITVARNRYIQTVQEYNVLARSFPTNLTAMVFSYDPKPTFTRAERSADLHAARRSTSARRSKRRRTGLHAARWPCPRAAQPLLLSAAGRLAAAGARRRRACCPCRRSRRA